MKDILNYIQEAIQLGSKSKIVKYHYHPKDNDELTELVNDLIKERGNEADLNDIDTSKITDMNAVFYKSRFDGDISKWDVSSVKDMTSMFERSYFTGKNSDLSKWNLLSVKDMANMFNHSSFNGDISNWDVSNVESMFCMFYGCKDFNQNLENWEIKNGANIQFMFGGCDSLAKKPSWYKAY